MCIIEPTLDLYLRSARRRAAQAFRPSTQKNQSYIVRLFIGFSTRFGLDFTQPSEGLLAAFLEHLARTQRTAASVISSFSTLRAALDRQGFPTHNFKSTSLSLLLRAIRINKRTPAQQRPPMSIPHLKRLLVCIMDMDYAHHLRAAIVLMFATNFRQSNLAPPTSRQFDGTRHLTRADVRFRSDVMLVYQKWSKTQQQVGRDRWIPIPRVTGSQLCPFSAMRQLLALSPTTSALQPLLTFDDGAPIPLSYINKKFRVALARAGLASANYTLHSLRRGGARFLQRSGLDVPDIAAHGGWRSSAIMRYINNPHKRAAFQALRFLK